MFILTKLINVFQKEYVSFADVNKIHLDIAYDAITAQFIGIDGSTLHMEFIYGNICKISIF